MPTNNFDQALQISDKTRSYWPNDICICHSPIASFVLICSLTAAYKNTAAGDHIGHTTCKHWHW